MNTEHGTQNTERRTRNAERKTRNTQRGTQPVLLAFETHFDPHFKS